MTSGPRVSIIITNYNYGRFLRSAIESALQQTYALTEVVVVDDGSTDHSRQVIAEYEGRVKAILKSNGGQASAFNTGFAASHGDIVVFLDADDFLRPHIVHRVAALYQAQPTLARVQYRLAVVEADGAATGAVVPPAYLAMPSGDFRSRGLDLNNYTCWPPTSGNAFAAWALRLILPMPEPPFRLCADYYLSRANALCGPIVALDEVGGCYRRHADNHYYASTLDLTALRRQVAFTCHAQPHLKQFADRLGVVGYPSAATETVDTIFLAQRAVSLKLDPERHPIAGDRLPPLCWHGVIAALSRPTLAWPARLLNAGWFVALLAAPPSLARRLAGHLYPDTRPSLNRLLAFQKA